jgi:hypothetical protein
MAPKDAFEQRNIARILRGLPDNVDIPVCIVQSIDSLRRPFEVSPVGKYVQAIDEDGLSLTIEMDEVSQQGILFPHPLTLPESPRQQLELITHYLTASENAGIIIFIPDDPLGHAYAIGNTFQTDPELQIPLFDSQIRIPESTTLLACELDLIQERLLKGISTELYVMEKGPNY